MRRVFNPRRGYGSREMLRVQILDVREHLGRTECVAESRVTILFRHSDPEVFQRP